MTVRDLRDQLRRQIGFIERSSNLYDQGFDDEAIRIAVALRVLLYDTGNSRSLLKQMGKKDSIRLVSTVKPQAFDVTPPSLFAAMRTASTRRTSQLARHPTIVASMILRVLVAFRSWPSPVYGVPGGPDSSTAGKTPAFLTHIQPEKAPEP